ncbi:MAG: ribulose-phosphate 3-epimerase [Lachnospiraceae bacterium]|nr:ribulose-phosphate 3-epimerase [Lachnospiraceae bacterium]
MGESGLPARKLAPSILAADFGKLGEQLKAAEMAGADMIHIDVMDGDYVPSISFGMPVIQSIRKETRLPFDVHLMVTEPGRYIKEFAGCGADSITVHVEACRHIDRVLHQIRETGLRSGVALNPGTSLSSLDYILDQVDMVLIMTVNPGFGGQAYIDSSTDKIARLRARLTELGLQTDIQVDGGIKKDNVHTVLQAGANIIVSGTEVFRGSIAENIKDFREIFHKI